MTLADEIKDVFEFWNSLPDNRKWRKHRLLTPDMKQAIGRWLRQGYTTAYLCGAIKNYHYARTTNGSWWHDKCHTQWSLSDFFGGGIKRKNKPNWRKFSPEEFVIEGIWTDEARAKYAKQKAEAQRREAEIQRQVDEKGPYILENKDEPEKLKNIMPEVLRRVLGDRP